MSADVEEAVRLIESVIRGLGLDPAGATIPGDSATKAYALKRGSARVVVAVHDTASGGALRVVAPVVRARFTRAPELNGTARGAGGFGSTGTA